MRLKILIGVLLLSVVLTSNVRASDTPKRQEEYQVILKPQSFKDRAKGVKKFFAYLEYIEDGDEVERFRYKKRSGQEEKREVIFFDTPNQGLLAANLSLQYRRWLSVDQPRRQLILKHRAPTEDEAFKASLIPTPTLKNQSKIEKDFKNLGRLTFAHVVKLTGEKFHNRVKSDADLHNLATLAPLFPELIDELNQPADTPLHQVRREFRWYHTDVKIKLAGAPCEGSLVLRYQSREDMEEGIVVPTKVEFSWKLKEDESNWNSNTFKASLALSNALWESPWRLPPAEFETTQKRKQNPSNQ